MSTPAKSRPRLKALKPSSPLAFSAAESAFLTATVEDGIRIQSRFRPQPLLARTGRGFMAPAGVAEMARLKKRTARLK